ncbi:GAF and ANTAR domain-containing protein [Kribbella solani]|uniref:GAF and ANTAR domain-containing protein n=1 Tax=Kribbella solani TaxID=236067 RepID=UPI0029C005F8|nr:GAF and ANTAR domain-containing protein [Kribbella solani]
MPTPPVDGAANHFSTARSSRAHRSPARRYRGRGVGLMAFVQRLYLGLRPGAMHDEEVTETSGRDPEAAGLPVDLTVASGFGQAAPDPAATAEGFARLALEMHEAIGVEETVQTVVEYALRALSCDYAGVALSAGDGRSEVPAVTDPAVAAIYTFQMSGGDGPLRQCMRERTTVEIPDTVRLRQWPEWTKKVIEIGVRSVLDVPLWTGNAAVGVLGLYSKVPDAFGPDEVAIAHILARHAAVAVATARREEHLKVAVDARKLVGQAMGILMERYDLSADLAFEVLRRYSQDTNTKLREVAQRLIDTRHLPNS